MNELKITKKTFYIITFLCFWGALIFYLHQPQVAFAADWYSSSWGYRKPVTIDHTKVSGSGSLTNFPVLISSTDAGLRTNANGYDIIFTDSDGTTKLNHEVEKYTAANGELVAWVKIPSLSPSTDMVIYMYYGNSSITTSQENKTEVWDSNYEGVWHMKESGTIRDSTSNNYDGTVNGATPNSSARINGGYNFDFEPSDYIEMGGTADKLPLTNFTVEAWIKTPVSAAGVSDYYAIAQSLYCNTTSWAIGITDDTHLGDHANEVRFTTRMAAQQIVYSNSIVTDNNWHHIVGVRNNPNISIYLDGSFKDSEIDAEAGQVIQSPVNIAIGDSGSCYPRNGFPGIIDEVRISNIARSADWIKTEYNNQNSPSTFLALGTEETYVPSGPDITPPVRSNGLPSGSDKVCGPDTFCGGASGFIGATLSLQTNENATCKYDTSPGKDFDSMANSFSTNDLVAHWKFDETSGTTAQDFSGNGNTGTLVNGPIWTTGGLNGALGFDGVNDYVIAPDSPSFDVNQITVSAWVYKRAANTNWAQIVSREWGTGYNDLFLLLYHATTNNYLWDVHTTDNEVDVDGGPSSDDLNKWVHLVGTYDGSSVKLYKNGTLMASAPLTGSMLYDSNPILIGAGDNGSNGIGEFTNAVIDDVRIYGRALSATEIQNLYNGTEPSATSGTFHSRPLANLENGKTYTYYVKCRDSVGNTNTDDYPISFSVSKIINGGLWGHYNKGIYSGDNFFYKTSNVENIDFNNFDAVLLNRIGQPNNATMHWYGAIFIEQAGTYNFRVDTLGQINWLEIGDYGEVWWTWGDTSRSVYLTAGWHWIVFGAYVYSWEPDSQIQLYWTPPGQSEQIIPGDHLSPQNWAEEILSIPDVSKPKERINYVVAGVGTGKISNPRIELTLPPKPIKDEIWIYWFYSENPNITITNTVTGVSRIVTGTRIATVHGFLKDVIFAKVPEVLIPGFGDLSLSFETTFTRADGISILIPYIDPSRPFGRISIRAEADSEYLSVSKAFIFPLNGEVNNDIRPFFIFGDGETKEEAPAKYRPNYLVMLSGKGNPPSEFDVLQNMGGVKLMPENFPLNLNKPDTWYPVYGREGPQLDVLSTNYTFNKWPGAWDTGGGEIKNISVPLDHTWIAFQYYSSNFPEDGVAGVGESTLVTAGGIFSSVSLLDELMPNIPSNLVASTGSQCATIDLTWNDNSDNENSFVLERKDSGGSFTEIAILPANSTSYQDITLVGGTYTYRVKACNEDNCSGYSNESNAKANACSDFTLSASGALYATIIGGMSAVSKEITIKVTNPVDFSSDVSLSSNTSSVISGATGIFSDSILSRSEYQTGSKFHINVPGNTPEGLYNIEIRGEGGDMIRTISVPLNIEAFELGWREI